MRAPSIAIAAVAALAAAVPGPAAAAGTAGTVYHGRTSSGHRLVAKVDGRGIIRSWEAGIRMACVPIQGGGRPLGGSELFGFRSTELRVRPHNRFTLRGKPAFHYGEVDLNYDLWLERRGPRIRGRMRLQYEFLIPKYPIGTFVVYSCLGGATFRATARR